MITSKLSRKKSSFLPNHIGAGYLLFENLVFSYADKFSKDYQGGQWQFMETSNSGFYMRMPKDKEFFVEVDSNFYSGTMSGDAFGVVVTLFALNNLVWKTKSGRHIKLYNDLIEFAKDHDEIDAIFGAID